MFSYEKASGFLDGVIERAYRLGSVSNEPVESMEAKQAQKKSQNPVLFMSMSRTLRLFSSFMLS